MTERKPFAITVQDLVARGRDQIPAELITSTHLIYNSPAALAFNSPGAQGFGVKRAGLAIPGSVMILIGPAAAVAIRRSSARWAVTATDFSSISWMKRIS